MTEPARPQPVTNWTNAAAAIGGLVTAIGTTLVIAGWASPAQVDQLQQAVAGIVSALGVVVSIAAPIIAGRIAKKQVTPVIDPVSHAGEPLKTAAQWQATYGKHAAVELVTHDTAADALRTVSDMATPDAPPAPNPARPQPFPRTDAEPSEFYSTLRAHADEMEPVTEPALHPLGRVVRHDPRSLQYLVPETTVMQSVMWDRKTPILDQGNLGSCTGNATVGVLGSTPFVDTLPGVVLDETEAVKVYSLATELDGFDGTYPPTDSGSSGLGAAQAAKQLGLISGYLHITSVAAAHTAIAQGPFIVGTDWYSGMDNPDANGIVHATGTIRGGHEYQCYGFDAGADLWWFWNSWGADWGSHGGFAYSSADFAKLLANSGDATTFVPITAPAPAPAPVPTPGPAPAPVPASWVTWARHVLTLKSESHATLTVAREIIAAAGQ